MVLMGPEGLDVSYTTSCFPIPETRSNDSFTKENGTYLAKALFWYVDEKHTYLFCCRSKVNLAGLFVNQD